MSQNHRRQWMMPETSHAPFWAQAEADESESA